MSYAIAYQKAFDLTTRILQIKQWEEMFNKPSLLAELEEEKKAYLRELSIHLSDAKKVKILKERIENTNKVINILKEGRGKYFQERYELLEKEMREILDVLPKD